MTEDRVILDSKKFALTLERLCHQLIENHGTFENTCIIGIQPRGIWLSSRINAVLEKLKGSKTWKYGVLDATFYRDDFRRNQNPLTPRDTTISFSIENKRVVLIDDVFYTGRTIRSSLDALLDFGRPSQVELLVLIDRRLSRQVPIQPDYVGKTVDSVTSEKVRVEWREREGEDKVWILSANSDRPATFDDQNQQPA